jgi:glutathione synthase/RimK-type ligase-like ATP-grasp enzyme
MTTESVDILLVTTAVDVASDAVAAALDARGASYFRLNTEALPLDSSASVYLASEPTRYVWVENGTGTSFENVKRVWFRRHRLPVLPSDIVPAHAEYIWRESQWFVRGLLLALAERVPAVEWMSPPLALEAAESKLLQLQVAQAVGLHCPPTLISNDPSAIREFFEYQGQSVVAKALKLGYFDYGEVQTATYTTLLSESDLEDATALVAAPVIYQRHVPKKCDVRVTVVGDDVFGAAIHSQDEPSARIDWRRTESDLPHSEHSLPESVRRGCLALMKRLGLSFGAIDLVLTPDGRYVFLEVNPSGQWLWLQDRLGFPITECIASWLTGPNDGGRR